MPASWCPPNHERMRLAIVDDEPLARLRLRSLLEALPEIGAEIVGEAGDATEAFAMLQSTPADAVLLDIRMPGAGANAGLRLAELLKTLARPPAVIFVTAHAEHALKAFEIEAVDYLTKPVRRERLLAALQRVAQRLRDPAAADPAPVLVFSDRGRVLRLPVAEVLYLKAELKYVTLRTAAHSHVLDESLSALEGRLGAGFIRVHRNALVARRAIRALAMRGRIPDSDGDGWAVRVAPLDEWLAVSRRQVAEVRAALADPQP
jgi:two-component system response regulator AlgR